jgi:hypothetical protein
MSLIIGHGSARIAPIARAVGADPRTVRALVRGDTRTVSLQLRELITAVYDAWWDKRAPARTRVERGAATAARNRAIAGDWCAAALDDGQLDLPGYRPPRLETRHLHRPRRLPTRTNTAKEGRMTPGQRASPARILSLARKHEAQREEPEAC